MENKYFDFDAAMAEKDEEKITVKAFGEKYEIPGDLPFDIILRISRRHKEGAEEMTEDDMIKMAHQLFGEEAFKKWLDKGISLRGIMTMVEGVMNLYMNNASDQSEQMAEGKKKTANP